MQRAVRARQTATNWKPDYALRAGVEGTLRQAIAVTGLRHTRYRGLAKIHLEHVFCAIALNLIRLGSWWNGHPSTGPAPPISPASNYPSLPDPN